MLFGRRLRRGATMCARDPRMARLRTNPVRSSLRAALAALVLACVAAAPALAQGGGDVVWSQFQGGPAHLGTAASAPLPPYREAWRFESDAGAVSGPVVVGDTAIAVGEHAVLAISLETGELAWQIARSGGPLSMPAVGTAGNGQVLVYLDGPPGDASASGSASPSSSASSTVSPSASPTASPSASPTAATGDTTAEVSELVAVDLADRSERWRIPLQDVSRSGVTIEGDRAYVVDDGGHVSAVELATGAVAWTAQALGRVDAPPAVADGAVYVVSRDAEQQKSEVLSLDAETGERRWSFTPPAGAVAVSAASVADGTVVFGAADRLVRGLVTTDGAVRWDALSLTLFSPASSPAFGPNGVAIADASAGIYRIDPKDGSREWDHQMNDLVVRSSPVFVEGYVLLGLNDGRLVAFDADGGDLVSETSTSTGLVGQLALTPSLVVASKGGSRPGLVAFEHDPQGALVRIPSPTIPDVGRLLGAFAVAFLIVGAGVLVPFRLLRDRFAPAFTREDVDMPVPDEEEP